MKFDYSPAISDDWPSAIAVTASGVEEGCGIEEGETRFYEPDWKHRIAAITIREQREKIHELQGFFKQCASRYSDVFEACSMEAPGIFTPKQHEKLLDSIAELRAAGATVEERCREMANGALEAQAIINEKLLKRNAELETLVLDMREHLGYCLASRDELAEFDERMRDAGIEVRDEVER